jgi:hypothetical protein
MEPFTFASSSQLDLPVAVKMYVCHRLHLVAWVLSDM